MIKEAVAAPLCSVETDSTREHPGKKLSTRIQGGRIDFLDVLRGIAALLVICQHTCEIAFPAFAHWTNKYVNFGEVGVVTFFIVSGFIIPVSLEKYNSLPRFWLGRIFRLWPPYIASLVAMLLVWPLVHELPEYFRLHPVYFVLGNLTMIQELLRVPFALGAYWTLSLELGFYLVCSVLFVLGYLAKTKVWLASTAFGLLVAQGVAMLEFHRSLPAGRLGLLVTAFFGTLLFRQLSNGLVSPIAISTVAAALLFSFAISFWIRFDIYQPIRANESTPVLQLNAISVTASWTCSYVLFLTVFFLRSRVFPRVSLWVGRISYPLYLFHGFVLAIVPNRLPWPLFLVIVITASLLLAHLVHILVEKPSSRLQHKLLRHSAVILRA